MATTEKQDRPSQSSESWDAERRGYIRNIMGHADDFMGHDNEICKNFAVITNALARMIDENPKIIFQMTKSVNGNSGSTSAPNTPDIVGGDFIGDLFDLIDSIIVQDKKYFLQLITGLL
ncbi:MAG: hypothetical protein KDD67_04125 [Ignavibacteriae bacterium]|nr:hypothetical protein [Ignavibacteriota bacterium]MCB9217645.1 hypothetical protein [Ignavibacteria bacterium]